MGAGSFDRPSTPLRGAAGHGGVQFGAPSSGSLSRSTSLSGSAPVELGEPRPRGSPPSVRRNAPKAQQAPSSTAGHTRTAGTPPRGGQGGASSTAASRTLGCLRWGRGHAGWPVPRHSGRRLQLALRSVAEAAWKDLMTLVHSDGGGLFGSSAGHDVDLFYCLFILVAQKVPPVPAQGQGRGGDSVGRPRSRLRQGRARVL